VGGGKGNALPEGNRPSTHPVLSLAGADRHVLGRLALQHGAALAVKRMVRMKELRAQGLR
jgi:hypothetical protein